jgi:hypothetical protein
LAPGQCSWCTTWPTRQFAPRWYKLQGWLAVADFLAALPALFGIHRWRHLRPRDIYKSADDLLYDAKAAGRNRLLMKMMPSPAPAPHEPLRVGT